MIIYGSLYLSLCYGVWRWAVVHRIGGGARPGGGGDADAEIVHHRRHRHRHGGCGDDDDDLDGHGQID